MKFLYSLLIYSCNPFSTTFLILELIILRTGRILSAEEAVNILLLNFDGVFDGYMIGADGV
jgi:hypothetical protein